MTDALASYALRDVQCDECRARKVSCSRDLRGCQRCKAGSLACQYSRSGVIRRHRKRRHEQHHGDEGLPPEDRHELQPQVIADIDKTREQLELIADSSHRSFSALSSLSDAHSAVWHDRAGIGGRGKDTITDFYTFEDRAGKWVDVFVSQMDRGQPFLVPPPAHVVQKLREARPGDILQRAWLILFYSIILSMVSSAEPGDESTKAKLRSNLWLALNDVKLLLEPSDLNIQALVMLACHVEEFTTPSLCWMLVTNACRMLQALGITQRRLDPETRRRRCQLFWHLNLLDKALAVIFGRPPTFHHAMLNEITMPAINELLQFQPHSSDGKAPSLFGAHYMHQMHLQSRITSDIWCCLQEVESNGRSVAAVKQDLDDWFETANSTLNAALVSERPFLNAAGVRSIELGLRTMQFGYYYFSILLARANGRFKAQCMELSAKMLELLDDMVSDSEEPYNGLVWQLMCCPFTPFLTLFREVLCSSDVRIDQKRQALDAMEHLPRFLHKMSLGNSLASKLQTVAEVFVQHASTLIGAKESASDTVRNAGSLPRVLLESKQHYDEVERPIPMVAATSTCNFTGFDVTGPGNGEARHLDWNPDIADVWTWTDDHLVNSMFDTFVWDGVL